MTLNATPPIVRNTNVRNTNTDKKLSSYNSNTRTKNLSGNILDEIEKTYNTTLTSQNTENKNTENKDRTGSFKKVEQPLIEKIINCNDGKSVFKILDTEKHLENLKSFLNNLNDKLKNRTPDNEQIKEILNYVWELSIKVATRHSITFYELNNSNSLNIPNKYRFHENLQDFRRECLRQALDILSVEKSNQTRWVNEFIFTKDNRYANTYHDTYMRNSIESDRMIRNENTYKLNWNKVFSRSDNFYYEMNTHSGNRVHGREYRNGIKTYSNDCGELYQIYKEDNFQGISPMHNSQQPVAEDPKNKSSINEEKEQSSKKSNNIIQTKNVNTASKEKGYTKETNFFNNPNEILKKINEAFKEEKTFTINFNLDTNKDKERTKKVIDISNELSNIIEEITEINEKTKMNDLIYNLLLHYINNLLMLVVDPEETTIKNIKDLNKFLKDFEKTENTLNTIWDLASGVVNQ